MLSRRSSCRLWGEGLPRRCLQASQHNPRGSAREAALKESKKRNSRSFCREGHSALVVETHFGSRAFPYLERGVAICGAESWMSVAIWNRAKARLIEMGFLARFACSDGSLLFEDLLGESIHLAQGSKRFIARTQRNAAARSRASEAASIECTMFCNVPATSGICVFAVSQSPSSIASPIAGTGTVSHNLPGE